VTGRGGCGRHGFALLAVLWIVAGVGVLALAGSLLARRAVATARNRSSWTIARWRAEGCVARARSLIAPALVGTPAQTQHAWRSLDRLIEHDRRLRAAGCRIELRAAGARIDVNAASRAQLRTVLMVAGVAERRADSLADALLDWRDVDDDPRPLGAERDWYLARQKLPPRNGPLSDVRELARVRGFASVPGVDTLFGVEPGRIVLSSASLATLAALPGFGAEAVARVAELRERGVVLSNVLELGAWLSAPAQAQLRNGYAELARLSASEPDAWILTATASAGEPAVAAHVEFRFVRARDRAVIVRERVW
jgi:type II secretory pathway component PulK